MVKITIPVETCSVYDDKRMPSLYMMEQIAWEVTCRNRGPVGFAKDGTVDVVIQPRTNTFPNGPLPPVTGEEK